MKHTFSHLTIQALLAVLALLALVPGTIAQNESEKPAEPEAPKFKMVIHETNPTNELPRKTVSRIFYKRTSRWEGWEDGKKLIIPIDRESESTVRKAFSEAVHERSASAIVSYWQRMIFSGREIPPKMQGSDEDVLNFIRKNTGAIGYVSGDLKLEDGVKELKISDLS